MMGEDTSDASGLSLVIGVWQYGMDGAALKRR